MPIAKFSTATRIGPATTIGSMVMHVVVAPQNAAGLADYARAASTPGDPLYRQFLTPSQIGDRYGARSGDYTMVAQYLASYGLKVLLWPQRLALTVAGPRQAFEKAFGTTFSFYRSSEGHTLLAPTGNIHFAKPLPVENIADAIADPLMKHRQFVRGAVGGPYNNSAGGYTPQQIAQAFDYTGAYAAGFKGQGISVGIIGTGPIQQADFTRYKSLFNWGATATGALTQVNVGSAAAANIGGSPTATPPPTTGPCQSSSNPYVPPSDSPTATCNPEDGEAQIDTEQATLAPQSNINFYLAYVPNECFDPTGTPCAPDPNTGLGYAYQGLDESDDEIQQAIADNASDVLSLSFGGPEILQGTYNATSGGAYDPNALGPTEFAALAAEGIAVFVSSGDAGAEGCALFSLQLENTPCVSYPSGDVSVTSVGGVTTPLNNAGQFVGPITAWGQQTASGGASGGGVSTIIPKPSFETGPNVSSGGRNQPDASLEGDSATAVATIVNASFTPTSEVQAFGGTSVAAPEMAAMWALVLSACKVTPSCASAGGGHPWRLGNAAPKMWSIYNGSSYTTTFYDVTFGNNALVGCSVNGTCGGGETPAPGYVAGSQYDLVTGIGVPFARHLIKAVVGV